MKSASLLVTVPDEIYENIVEPMKRDRTFASFMNSLLQAYYESDEIQSYVEGLKDNANKKSLDSLTSAIDKANSVLSRFGLYTDELENVANMGMQAVKNVSTPQTNNSDGGFNPPSTVDNTPLLEQFDHLKLEIGSIKDDNKELKDQNEKLLEQNAELINILGKISSGSLSIVGKAQGGVKGEASRKVPEPKPVENRLDRATPVVEDPVRKATVKEPPKVVQPVESVPGEEDFISLGDIVIDEPVVTEVPEPSKSVQESIRQPKVVQEPVQTEPNPSGVSLLDSEEELLDFGIDFDEEDDVYEEDEDDVDDSDLFDSFMENNAFQF